MLIHPQPVEQRPALNPILPKFEQANLGKSGIGLFLVNQNHMKILLHTECPIISSKMTNTECTITRKQQDFIDVNNLDYKKCLQSHNLHALKLRI